MIERMARRASAFVAWIVLLLSFSAVHAEDRYTAAEILSDCQAILESSKSSGNAEELELDNTFSTGVCWGAFLSLQQIIVTKKEGGKNTLLQICAPRDATLLQLIQVFYVFVQSNPRRQDEPFTKVALAAFRSAYPCG